MASPQVYIGVDIGTSGCRAIVVGEDGRTLAAAVRTYPLHTPAPGWVEQDPRDWIAGAFAVIAEVCASGAFEPADVRGVGVDGQSWACVPVAEDGTVLANTPIWMDMRSQPICDELLAAVPADELLAVGGNRLSPSYSTAKALWFERNRPDVFARARWFLQCNSAVVMALTGVAGQDHSQGYGWHFIDVATGRIRGDLARRLGIDPGRVPDPVEPSAVVGGVTADAARATGLPTGTPVVAGGSTPPAAPSAPGCSGPGRRRSRAVRRAACRSRWTPRSPTSA